VEQHLTKRAHAYSKSHAEIEKEKMAANATSKATTTAHNDFEFIKLEHFDFARTRTLFKDILVIYELNEKEIFKFYFN
jgi:hypothetical protein